MNRGRFLSIVGQAEERFLLTWASVCPGEVWRDENKEVRSILLVYHHSYSTGGMSDRDTSITATYS